MDENFLSQILGKLKPEDGTANPYSAVSQLAMPQGNSSPQSLLAGIPGYGSASAPDNMLQSLNIGESANAAPQPQAQPEAGQPPRQRRSFLDTIGRIADVFAKVGGAEALYQPTLDAREDRGFAAEDRARQIDLDKLKLETAQGALGDAGRARLAQAVRGTQALLASNPQADVSKIFPLLAQRAGLDPTQAASLAAQLAENPGLLDGLAGFDDQGDKYGGSVVYAKGPDGKVVAFQPNLKGGRGRAILPEGFTAVDPLKFVDTGNEQVGVGTRSGEVGQRFEKGVRPDTIANNRTAITIAGMPARTKPATAAAPGATNADAMRTQATELLGELRSIYGDLNKSGALVNPRNGVVGNVLARLRSSGAGQIVEGTIGTEAQSLRDRINSIRPSLMQSLAKATGITGKQLDSNADVKLFMQTVTDPSKSYQANLAAIAGLERFLKNAKPPAPTRALPPRIPASGGGGGKTRTLVYNPKTGKIE